MNARPRERVHGQASPSGAPAPLFLIGAARSGTSLLYKCICLHPDAAFISNWVRRYPGLPVFATLNRLARRAPAAQRRVWFGGGANAYVYGRQRRVTDRLFPMPVEGEPVFARAGIPEHRPEDSTPDGPERLRQAFESIARWDGGRRIVSKRIANNRRIPLLAKAFPGARYAHIVRDGRAVAYSLSRVNWWEESHVWWYGSTPKAWAAEGRDPWELCARNWVEELHEIERGLEQVPEEDVMRIKYEDVLRDPGEVVTRVAEFGGFDRDPAWAARLRELQFPDQNEAWPVRMDPDAIALVQSIQRTELTRQGYEA